MMMDLVKEVLSKFCLNFIIFEMINFVRREITFLMIGSKITVFFIMFNGGIPFIIKRELIVK